MLVLLVFSHKVSAMLQFRSVHIPFFFFFFLNEAFHTADKKKFGHPSGWEHLIMQGYEMARRMGHQRVTSNVFSKGTCNL